jgi:hypothetical protein
MWLLFLSAFGAVTLDDIAIGVLASTDCILDRIVPMTRTWFQMVPQVDVWVERNLSADVWPLLLQYPRSNVVFHVQTHEPYELYGSKYETAWNWAQYRHLHAIADLWERYPNKSFYVICDDDTFLLPANILRFANSIDSESKSVSGQFFGAVSFVDRFSGLETTGFTHGGSGQFVTGGLMRIIGPQLRKCSRVFGIPNIGSDIRFAICISRTVWEGKRLSNRDIHQRVHGFNAETPDVEVELLSPGWQYSFHKVTEERADLIFAQMITRVGNDEYYDWSPIAFRRVHLEAGGYGRGYHGVFGHLICVDVPVSLRMKARAGIVQTSEDFANFSQAYAMNFELFIRCNSEIEEGAIGYFGEPPAPHFGVIVEARCPALTRFKEVTAESGVQQITFEEGSIL